MKVTWTQKNNKKRRVGAISGLPFDDLQNDTSNSDTTTLSQTQSTCNDGKSILGSTEVRPSDDLSTDSSDVGQLAESFRSQGNKLAEEGKYREALGKWETALTLNPGNGVLQEQKAQVLLEIGDSWSALKAATQATELEPSWAEAWITLGRAQLNFGEPDTAIQSFDRALAITPDSEEAQDDRRTALHLVKKRKLLHSSGLSSSTNRYAVSDKSEST